MNNETILDLTKLMERLINENVPEIDIMRKLLNTAEAAHQMNKCKNFRIGSNTYSLNELEKIQQEEEHEAWIAQHR